MEDIDTLHMGQDNVFIGFSVAPAFDIFMVQLYHSVNLWILRRNIAKLKHKLGCLYRMVKTHKKKAVEERRLYVPYHLIDYSG